MAILEEKKGDFKKKPQFVKQVLEAMILQEMKRKGLLVHVLSRHLKEIKLIKALDQKLVNID